MTALRESRWIAPNDHCPHPEWWHSTDFNATEIEVTAAVQGVVRALQPDYVVETGTASAQTTIAIGLALRKNGHGRLVSLEIDPRLVEHGRQLCRRLPVEIRQQSSLDFIPDHLIDFAWLDSLPEIRHLEFRRYYPYMHRRTIVGFHDTGPFHPTRGFVDEIEQEGLVKTIDFPTPRGFSLGRVQTGAN
jgi:hypothetical protein